MSLLFPFPCRLCSVAINLCCAVLSQEESQRITHVLLGDMAVTPMLFADLDREPSLLVNVLLVSMAMGVVVMVRLDM